MLNILDPRFKCSTLGDNARRIAPTYTSTISMSSLTPSLFSLVALNVCPSNGSGRAWLLSEHTLSSPLQDCGRSRLPGSMPFPSNSPPGCLFCSSGTGDASLLHPPQGSPPPSIFHLTACLFLSGHSVSSMRAVITSLFPMTVPQPGTVPGTQ